MKHTQKFLQRRKRFMVLPLLTLPFLTMIFWTLGGGHGIPVNASPIQIAGLNFELPEAQFQETEIWNKLTLYEMAEHDSAKFEEARESDPYFDLVTFQAIQDKLPQDDMENQGKLIDSFPHRDKLGFDPNEERVNRKLQELYTEINKPATTTIRATDNQQPVILPSSDPQFSSDVEKLKQMMEMMNDNSAADPEMVQIKDVLDKILDIQHPERVKDKFRMSNELKLKNALPVLATSDNENISLIQSNTFESEFLDSIEVYKSFASTHLIQNAFYGLEDELPLEEQNGNAIEAIIHDTQELVTGSTVKMRLLEDIKIKGLTVAKDQFIYGTCDINGERLNIEINSIHAGNSLLPVSLSVYDLDGMEGIYIPGAITREAAKQTSDDALQNIQLMSLDPSIGAQAASAGIEAVKGLFSKKAKLIKVTVKAGYHIFLQDKNSNIQ